MRTIELPEINAFERALLDALLAGDLEVLLILREQLSTARAVTRELSGAGFFLRFEVPASARRTFPLRFVISDVYFELLGIEHGGGAILFVRDGVLSMLEGYSNTSGWPEEPKEFCIHYYDGERRSLEKVQAEIVSRGGLPA